MGKTLQPVDDGLVRYEFIDGFARHKRDALPDAYDALETSDSAVKVLGDDTLRAIARELVATVRENVTIAWTIRRERPGAVACDLVGFKTDHANRLVGEAWVPLAGLDGEEWSLYVNAVGACL